MVEAMETLFVPVAIRNNVEGYERTVLERYEEPTWNNPVIRFVDATGADVLPRKDRVWSTPQVLGRMLAALEAVEQDVPAWLDAYAQETLPGDTERAVFAMHCFWDGQAQLGGLDGVVSATPGWVGSSEVIEVVYRTDRVNFPELLGAAKELNCTSQVFTTTPAQAEVAQSAGIESAALDPDALRPAKTSDDLHSLARSPMRFLPLTPLQALRVNAALRQGEDALALLSPSQRALALRVAEGSKKLANLERPVAIDQLDEYTAQLEAALAKEE